MAKTNRPLRAKPLVAEALPEEQTTTVPPAPIPVEPIPVEPIPVEPQPTNTAGKTAAPILLTEAQKRQRELAVNDRGWKRGRKAVGAKEEMDQRAEEGSAAVFWRDFLHQHRSWAVSAFVHTVIVVTLGLLTLSFPSNNIELVSLADVPDEFDLQEIEAIQTPGPDVENVSNDIVDRVEVERLEPKVDMQNAAEGIDAASVELVESSLNHAPLNDLLCEAGLGTGQANARGTGKGRNGLGSGLDGAGGGLGGRGGRLGNATGLGATPESEAAVDLALKWLAEHQLPDGSWSYNHHLAPSCQGQCPAPGAMPEAQIAATAMGILPFLGAGETHQVGKYQRTVGMGLNYLIARMQLGPQGGSLMEPGGRMYSHGLATIALCEAFGMQKAKRKLRPLPYDGEASPGEKRKVEKQKPVDVPGLGRAAQAALNFIASAQDPVGGGWRYVPRTPGDTSVVGWQLMGLLSGKMSYLVVNPNCFVGATHFLNHVQTDDYGSNYGYTDNQRASKATQAIGLLGRMYLGWAPDHPGISQGVQQLGAAGPSRQGSMYYNSYATQVLHHHGGEPWKQWNPRMRDWLVGCQSKAGHTAGSWHFGGGDRGADKGGRVYCTSMAAMTLEVYYRHMPLYRKDALMQAKAAAEKKEAEKEEDRPNDEF